MAAKNPIRFRSYSTGAPLNRAFRLYREGSTVMVESVEGNQKQTINCKTVSEAKRIMDVPGLVCK